MSNEPVLWTNVVMGVIASAIVALKAFNIVQITDEQQSALMGFLTPLFAAVNVLFVRKLVTPIANPKDSEGNTLVSTQKVLKGVF